MRCRTALLALVVLAAPPQCRGLSAAVGAHRRAAALPRIRVVVAVSDDAVQLKFADEAGGIKRSSLINVWSYRALESSWWTPADGLRLPLVRLYCKYFGGSLALVPIEGFGTDCYVTLNRLPHENVERIEPRASRKEDERTAGMGMLFDAQSRRRGKRW